MRITGFTRTNPFLEETSWKNVWKADPVNHVNAQVVQAILNHLKGIQILPRRILLSTPRVEATIPMIRGTWGYILNSMNLNLYSKVFNPPNGQAPLYLFRQGPDNPRENPCLDYFLFNEAIEEDRELMRVWGKACRAGLGPDRIPFFINGYVLDSFYNESKIDQAWNLSEVEWPITGSPETTPCKLIFHNPLRILRNKQLIHEPTFSDIIVSIHRRIDSLIPHSETWKSLLPELVNISRKISQLPWRGERLDFVRWSSRQQSEVDMHGVCGELVLPDGPDVLWPLLAAAQWVHVGKGSIMGLGQQKILPWNKD